MNTAVIIKKEPGQVIPRGYLQEALKNCPTCFGITLQDKVDNEPVLDTSAEVKNISVDELFKMNEQCKDVRMVIWLGNMSNDFDKDTDLQPFVFQQKAEGDPEPQDILSFNVEGDLPNYSKPGAGHTDEYNFWENFVYPTLLEKFEASEDLPDFYRRISSSQFEQAMMNPVGHRAAFVFVPLEGDPIEFGRNDLGAKFDWGTTSNAFGWGNQTKLENAAAAATAAVKKTGSRLSQLMGSAAPAPEVPANPPAEAPKKENPPGVHDVPDKGTNPFAKWPNTSSKTHTMVTVPSGLQGNARNRWIRIFLSLDSSADLPKGKDAKGFAIPVPNEWIGFSQEDVSTNDEVKALANKVKKFQASGSVTQQMKEANEEPAAPKEEPKKAEPEKRSPEEFLPEVSADESKISTDLVTEWATNPKAPTALEVQRIESKWPKFTVSRGITLENVARWNMAEKKTFTKKCPNDAARLISELIIKIEELGGLEKAVNTEHQNDVQRPPSHATKSGGSNADAPPQSGGTASKKKSRLAQLSGQAA